MINIEQPTVDCEMCGNPTPMLGTKRCDPCWELEKRVRANVDLAQLVMRSIPVDHAQFHEAVQKLYEWQHCNGTSFSCAVLELCAKADVENARRIHLAWPHLYAAWMAWHHHPNSDDFFREHGFTIT